MHHYYWWKTVLKGSLVDNGVGDHLFFNELLETALFADGLGMVNLQRFGMIARRMQLRWAAGLLAEAHGAARRLCTVAGVGGGGLSAVVRRSHVAQLRVKTEAALFEHRIRLCVAHT